MRPLMGQLWASLYVHTGFPANASGQDHGQAGRCSSQCWPRTEGEKVPRGSSCLIIHQGNVTGCVIQSSVATLLGLSTDFQEASGNPPDRDVKQVTTEPALFRHQQWDWSSHPLLLQIKEFKGERDHQLSPSDLSCSMCRSVVLRHDQHDVFG